MQKIIFLLACALLYTTAGVFAAEDGQAIGAWTVKCVPNEDADTPACHIFQKIVVERTGNTEKAVHMSLGFAPDESEPVTIIRMPLGLWLMNGITLAVDDGPAQQFPIQVCAPAGCQTTLRLQPNILDALKSGRRLIVTTFNTRQEPVQIPIDLNGFSDALTALQAD